jgi:muramoyltetrapeptide carboxypeptidase
MMIPAIAHAQDPFVQDSSMKFSAPPPFQLRSKIFPPALKKGNKIAITAPASPTSSWEIRNSVKVLSGLGYKIEIGDTILKHENKYRYLSAPDEARADEFNKFAEREDIACILCGRGGYGTLRILDMIYYDAFLKYPKIVIGFSDITALINAIHIQTGLVTFHGPVAVNSYDQLTLQNFKNIFTPKDAKPIKLKEATTEVMYPGKTEGRLVGGNLSMLVSTLGTAYEIDATDSILFIEDISEHPYKIDKMLSQLRLSGKFDQCKGIAVGVIEGMNTKRPFYPGGSFTIREVLDQILKPLKKPLLTGLSISHYRNSFFLPIGVGSTLDAVGKQLIIKEQAVQI